MLSKDDAMWGAVPVDQGTQFKVWAPKRKQVEVVLERNGTVETVPLQGKDGVFTAVANAPAGTRYKFKLDGGEAFADPCTRSQPDGPHAASEVVDPRAFKWTDAEWPGSQEKNQIIYEMHVGAFTPAGTFVSAIDKLDYLKDLGITIIELMPLNGFPGRFNWGYDGVNLWAPNATYGTPDDLRRFVDAAHARGLGVIVDVVYNHFGPDGNYLAQFSDSWFNDKHPADWGAAVNFDGEGSDGVRTFVSQNAAMWIREYHLDGLRLDAVQNLFDSSQRHVVADITTAAREAAGAREVWMVGEVESQDRAFITPIEKGGANLNAMWVDDFHHACRVAWSGQAEAYLQDFEGSARELVSLALRNSLYAGQFHDWQQGQRGTDLRRVEHHKVVFALQNHDQVSASLRGQRFHQLGSNPAARALTVFQLLLPQTPMLFMGQEFFADAPFIFFVDHNPELQSIIAKGRGNFISEFASIEQALVDGYQLDSPESAFEKSKLDWQTLEVKRGVWELYRELISFRRSQPLFHSPRKDQFDAAVLGADDFVMRWTADDDHDFLLVLSLDADRDLTPCSEPLLAAPRNHVWQRRLSSEEARFGGRGAIGRRGRHQDSKWKFQTGEGPWRIQGRCATLLEAVPR